MSIPDLRFDLNETERAVRETAHQFAAEVLRPAGEALDKLSAEEMIAEGSILYDVHDKYHALGLGGAAEDLTPLEAARISGILSEELGWGDAGLAISCSVGSMAATLAQASGNADLIARFPATRLGCWAVTEPNHGTDIVDMDTRIKASGANYSRPDCIAKPEGNGFRINGQKSAWVSNGTIAKQAALYCACDRDGDVSGGGVFLVDLTTRGVSRGKPLDKIGQRALNQGEIFFDDVFIPADHMVVPPEIYAEGGNATLTGANTGMGVLFAGLAKAAFDEALEYAKTRIQGGVPIIQHQSVKARIFTMYRKVEAARALAWSTHLANAVGPTPDLTAAIAAKVTSTQTAFEVASEALQIFGGNGISREYPVEKMLRDARISMIEDGCNETLGLIAAGRLAQVA
jgi:alkylation response protein AidB-like acyl-CoA dehydrogenase